MTDQKLIVDDTTFPTTAELKKLNELIAEGKEEEAKQLAKEIRERLEKKSP